MNDSSAARMIDKLHDINNQLCIGSGYSELLLQSCIDAEQRRMLLLIKGSIDKIGMIVRDSFDAIDEKYP